MKKNVLDLKKRELAKKMADPLKHSMNSYMREHANDEFRGDKKKKHA